MKKRIVIIALLLAAALLAWRLTTGGDPGADSYRFVEVRRGTVESTVSSTGLLQAIRTVKVGTQVSGQVSDIHADFNDRVTRGQLIARIDPTLLEQEVRSAAASVERSTAECDQARREQARIAGLYANGVVMEKEDSDARYQLAVADASRKAAAIALERAERNLTYTEIRSPIDGVVIDRNVDVGQTVAASLAAPQLFLIAEDLSRLEILAAVDESDIGRIAQGQAAHFTVQAYPDRVFTGAVSQVRLQSTVKENVVNYSVVVTTANPDGALLPGMTATVDFVLERAADVLLVPNSALRFRPAAQPAAAGAAPTRLWSLGADGRPGAIAVTTGLSDGQNTVVAGNGLREGLRVIAATTTAAAAATASPFQSQPQGGPPPPGM